MRIYSVAACAAILTASLCSTPAFAIGPEQGVDALLGNAITYQGSLDDNGVPADGNYDMRFSLFSSSGVQINSPVTYIGVQVAEGVFNVDLEFDQAIWTEFASIEKYLQIEVRNNGGGGYTALTPRTLLASAPHANVAKISHGLSFPYVESLTGYTSDDIAFDLSVNEGTALRLHASNTGGAPVFLVEGQTPIDYGFLNHTAMVNDSNTFMGLLSIGDTYSLVGYNNTPFGPPGAGVLAQVGMDASESTAALFAAGHTTMTFLGRENYSGLFFGDLHVEYGAATKSYNSFPSPMAPAAYGFVALEGSLASGTANMFVSWNASLSQYEITLSDQTISFSSHTTVVTVVDSNEPHVATTNANGGFISVKIWNIAGGNVAIQDNFQIIIFNANPDAPLTLSPVPAGMDPEYYYEQTGTSPPVIPHAAPVEIPEPASIFRD